MIDLFEPEEKAILFIDKIIEKYKRYARDQFMVLEKSIQLYPAERDAAPEYCIENELWSANDFRDVAAYLSQHKWVEIPNGIESISTTYTGIEVSTRSFSEYAKIIGVEVNE